VEYSRFVYYVLHREREEANHYWKISNALFSVVDILGPVTNLISCLILALVVRHIYRLSNQVQAGSDTVAAKRKVNMIVTASHIGVTLAFTVSQFLILFVKNPTQVGRMYSAFTFFGALADLYLSLMLWFILDSEKAVTVLVDGDRVYAVEDVINPRHSGVNEHCIEEELQEDISSEYK